MKIKKQFEKHLSLFLYNNFDRFYMRGTIKTVRDINKGKKVVGCEIGCNRGIHSANILRMLNINELYLIDCFVEDDIYGNCNDRYNDLISRLEKYSDKYVFVNGKSEQVVDKIPDDLDFVYIDGGHDYKTVTKDCILYYPKVKKGGVFGGHDYKELDTDVNHAVNDFLKGIGRLDDLNTNKMSDWWIVKK